METDKEEIVLDLLPLRLRKEVSARIGSVEEIRLRSGRRPTLLINGREEPAGMEPITADDLLRILERATGASLHTAKTTLADGFLDHRGVRIGVCGQAVLKNGEMSLFHSLSSLVLRVPRECRGICRHQIDTLLQEGFQNTLVIGVPGAGKTTALREMIRRLSDAGYRIGVADERNELAAYDGEAAAYDLGKCTDILGGLPKEKAAMMLLRGMNPQIIAMDEISRKEDMAALVRICGCGVGVLASAHAAGKEDLDRRDEYRSLLERGMFSRLLTVRMTKEGREYRLEGVAS